MDYDKLIDALCHILLLINETDKDIEHDYGKSKKEVIIDAIDDMFNNFSLKEGAD